MKTFRNTLARISTISLRRFFLSIDLVHQAFGKSRFRIFFDMVFSYIRYGTGYLDFVTFGFAELNSSKRKTYMNMNHNLRLVRQMNQPDYRYLLDDKLEFCRFFSDLLAREWLDLREVGCERFEEFLNRHGVVFAKPVDQFGGKGILRIETAEQQDIAELYKNLLEHKKYDVEEQILQHHIMNQLSAGSVNSLRMTTLVVGETVHLLYTLVRIGDGLSYVDNISSGGMYCLVDEQGMIYTDAFCDEKMQYYDRHPNTGTKFSGFLIPYYPEAVLLVTEAALRITNLRYVGWDVAITENGPALIEGNVIPGYDMPQNHMQTGSNRKGIMTKINELVGDI
ncbi:MAG: hypothetical protein FWG21_01225 [Oscillospiraceae bacterium]|nr:hypothetical protein [Oscillospiraceae bacterium]